LPRPDADDFEITDFGHTIRLGKFEAAADAILYEFDAEARRRLKQRSLASDATFGGALRRLRLQRGLRREDFEGVSAKEIARIERGEITKPHADTLARLADRLGVRPDEIETF
ncbi:MAG TPA: helix-turn-helix transcriptional regulator, partial [Polyangiaceae bacterium]|nr:helix-turn-helix transcriptional regulator [Polyangiaceae bacterium]